MSSRCRRSRSCRRRPTRRCSLVPRAAGRKRNGPPHARTAFTSFPSGAVRCAPTRSRSPRSAFSSFCGAISESLQGGKAGRQKGRNSGTEGRKGRRQGAKARPSCLAFRPSCLPALNSFLAAFPPFYLAPSSASALRDFKVCGLDAAVTERDVLRAGAVLVEIRWIEPLALFGGIDGDQVVIAARQTADFVFSGLIGACGHDLSRQRPPQRRVG